MGPGGPQQRRAPAHRGADRSRPTATLVAELSAASGEFAALWRRHDVWVKRGGETAIRHPVIGPLTLANEVLSTAGDGQRIWSTRPPGTAEHDALVLLAMTTEDIATP